VYGEIVGCHRGETVSASVRVAEPPPKKTSTAGRMAESQCLPQAHDFFSQRKGTQVAEKLHGLRSTRAAHRYAHSCCCSNWSGCFWNGRGHTVVATPFFVPTDSSSACAWKAKGLSVRPFFDDRRGPGAGAGPFVCVALVVVVG
jgi:hypothetical protein